MDNLLRSEYVIRLYNRVRMLSDAPSERVTVDKFSRHFDENIEMAIITQRIMTIEGLINLLDIQDHIGKLNSSRGPVRYESFNESYSSRHKF